MATKEYNIMGYDGNGYFVNKTVSPSSLYTLAVPSLPFVNTLYKGKKQYELGNLLGNVLATISDRRIGIDDNADLVIDYYNPDIMSVNDYYAFGSAMPGRSLSVKGYRYGFNNQEKDEELGDYYAFEYRIHDARLGRFLSVDPLAPIYPWYTPYQFAGNMPIWARELEGLEPSVNSFVEGSNSETVDYILYDEVSKYKVNVSINSANGDKLIYDNNCEKVIGFKTDGIEFVWDSENSSYHSTGGTKILKTVSIVAIIEKTLMQKWNEFEYQLSSVNGIIAKKIYTTTQKVVSEHSPQGAFINFYTGLARNEDMFGNYQSDGQTYLQALSFVPVGKVVNKSANWGVKIGAKTSRGLWTLTKAGASAIKNHKTFGTFYKSTSDGLWWVVDKSGHGGSKFKVFKETNKGLEWIADADEFGDFIINKHKSTTGTFISWGQLSTVK